MLIVAAPERRDDSSRSKMFGCHAEGYSDAAPEAPADGGLGGQDFRYSLGVGTTVGRTMADEDMVTIISRVGRESSPVSGRNRNMPRHLAEGGYRVLRVYRSDVCGH